MVLSMEENIEIYRRYIADISCIRGYGNDIWWRNIVLVKFQGKILNIGDMAINRRFFSIYRNSQRDQTRYSAVKQATMRSKAL